MTAFADASTLVKLYVPESGHDVVRALSDLVIAQISRVEVAAVLWRKVWMGEVDAADAAVLVGAFEADFHGTDDQGADPPRFAVVTTSADVLESRGAARSGPRPAGLRRHPARQCDLDPVRRAGRHRVRCLRHPPAGGARRGGAVPDSAVTGRAGSDGASRE